MTDKVRTIEISPPTRADKPAWRRLYCDYAAFYNMSMADSTINRVWAWVRNPQEPLEARVARDPAGRLIGLAHFRPMLRPLTGSMAGFLDDLFVAPAARGNGVGKALIEAVAAACHERGWTPLRWITRDDNYQARALYDRLARRTMWVTYERDPATTPDPKGG